MEQSSGNFYIFPINCLERPANGQGKYQICGVERIACVGIPGSLKAFKEFLYYNDNKHKNKIGINRILQNNCISRVDYFVP